MSTNENDNMIDNDASLIDLEIPIHLKKSGVIKEIGIHKQFNSIVVKLGNTYNNRNIVSEIYHSSWEKTTSNFRKRLSSKGVDDHDITKLEDILDSNFEKVLEPDERNQELSSGEGTRQCAIRKYTCNGTIPLHECVVIGSRATFVYLDNNKKDPMYIPKKIINSRTLYPADTLDSQNPLPYNWGSPEEFDQYLDLAKQETVDSLFMKVRSVYKKYVNIEDYYITILSADTIYSYFQDKFPTVHYNIFIGDNGSGKNSALLIYRYLGYRVLYVTSASAPNYFTFLGEIEECQGSIAEDEADDIGYDKDKLKILKTGYSTGGNVPKVDLSNGRTQGSYLTYCMKWFAMESLPDSRKIRGVLDRAFVYHFVIGDVQYNIKDVIKYAGDPKFKPLNDELFHLRKLLFAFRMLHYDDVIKDLELNVRHRTAELIKPLLRMFSSLGKSTVVQNELIPALSEFVRTRNESKNNSFESKLRDTINNLIKKQEEELSNGTMPEVSDMGTSEKPYEFSNHEIWNEAKNVMGGHDDPFHHQSFHTLEFGLVSQKNITQILKSKFCAQPIKKGSGQDTERGLRFNKYVLDRIEAHYDTPTEIKIYSQNETCADATDATHATLMGREGGTKENGTDAEIELREEGCIQDRIEADDTFVCASDIKDTGDSVGKQVNCVENNNININNYRKDTNINRLMKLDYPYSSNSHPHLPLPPSSCSCTIDKSPPNHDITLKSITMQDDLGVREEQYQEPNLVDISHKTASLSTESVASVASVAKSPAESRKKTYAEETGLPEIPCIFCDYKDCIELDLEFHLLERHRPDLIRLPVEKGSMDYRAECAVAIAKKRMSNGYMDDDEDGDCDFEESEDVEKEDYD